MGSRVMHYVVSLKLVEKLHIKEKEVFLLGGVAADASNNKDVSHFFQGDHQDYTRNIAYEKFYEKYKNNDNKAYILGYYAHLITDHIWLTGFYLPWLKNRMETDQSIHKQYHNDFSLLNSKLANYYNLSSDQLPDMYKPEIPDLDEVSAENVKKLFTALSGDLSSSDTGSELKVFTFEQIIGYIETAIEVSTRKVNEKIRRETRLAP